jgi:PAS domain S-box-containing protein
VSSGRDGPDGRSQRRRRPNMDVELEGSAEEVKQLRRCVNDLVSVLALPAIWTGGEPSQIVSALLDALLGMLNLDLIYMRLKDPAGKLPIEMARIAPTWETTLRPQQICEVLNNWFGDDPQKWPPPLRSMIGDTDISTVPLTLGLQGEIGVIAAGSQRADFPRATERLVLSVAANQAAIGLQAARLLSEQKHLADELDQRVAQRTAELAEANQALREEIAERRRAEQMLQVRELNLRLIVDSIPAPVAVVTPAGEVESVNQPILAYFGKTFEDLKHWGTSDAVHPHDLPHAIAAWREAIETGRPYEVKERLRRFDGVYRWFDARGFALRDPDGRILNWCILLTDIDDRYRAEEALRASERSLDLSINAMPTLLASARPDGFGDFFNQRWLDYTGLSASKVEGWGWGDAIHPDDINNLMEQWRSSLVSGTPVEAEARMRRFDGAFRWLLFRANALRDEPGKIVKWYVTTLDIEDRKRAEEALRASERNLRSIIDTIPTAAWSTHPDGHCDFINQRWLDYAGLSADQGLGWGWRTVIHPDDERELLEYWHSCLASGRSVDTETRMRRFDGVYRWFLFRANPLRDESGKIVKWYGTNIDIDDRKRAEDELRRKEAFLADAQRLSVTGSFTWHLDTDEIAFSEQLYRIFEFEQGSPLTFARIGSRVHPEDLPLLSEKIDLARTGTNNHNYEIRLQMLDGRVKYLRTNAYGARDRDGRLEFLGAIQDVTERRRSEEALAEVRSELAHMARVTSLGALTASIAHEVNQPLSGIITNAGTCLRMLTADPPNVEGARETARRTIRDGNRASEVVTRLRALFKKKDPTTETVDLNEATQEVIALSSSELQRNRVILRTEFASDLPAVSGDRVQLQQVILNLLRNGSDAMSEVDDHPRQLVIRTEREDGDRVRMTVRDVGTGFAPQAMDRLFEAFYTTKQDGMGMGLSLSRSIIESHHGRLWATPNDGPGATFSFSIPRDPGAATGARSVGAI